MKKIILSLLVVFMSLPAMAAQETEFSIFQKYCDDEGYYYPVTHEGNPETFYAPSYGYVSGCNEPDAISVTFNCFTYKGALSQNLMDEIAKDLISACSNITERSQVNFPIPPHQRPSHHVKDIPQKKGTKPAETKMRTIRLNADISGPYSSMPHIKTSTPGCTPASQETASKMRKLEIQCPENTTELTVTIDTRNISLKTVTKTIQLTNKNSYDLGKIEIPLKSPAASTARSATNPETKPAAAPAASAKTINISGSVLIPSIKDSTKFKPAVGANISSNSKIGVGTSTDSNGKFELKNIDPNHTINISYQGCAKTFTASSIPPTIKLDCVNEIDGTVISANSLIGKPCRDEYIKGLNAESGKFAEKDNGGQFCDIKCRKNYTKTPGTYEIKLIDPNTKEPTTSTQPYKCICSGDFVEIGTECLPVSGCSKDKGVHESKYEKSGDTYECIVKSCDCGYTLNNGKCEKWDTSECTTMPENASKIERTCKNGAEFCEIKKCECGYTQKNNQCVKMDADTCTKKPAHATKVGHACNDGVETCNVIECEDGWKPEPEINGTQCIRKLKECTPEQKEQLTKEHATQTGIKPGTETCIALACECGFKPDDGKCVEIPENTPCDKDDLPKNASAGIKACKNGKPYCQITACLNETEYTHDKEKNRCEYLKGETCTHTDTNAERAEWKNVDGKLVCTLKKCKSGFYVVDDKCEPSDGECTPEQLKQIEHAIKGERKKDKCTPTECEPGFEPSGKKCVEIAGKCKTKPEHSKKSKRVFDETTKTEICQVVECEDGYRVSADGQKCEPSLDEKQARKKAAELRANADEMKAVEQSTENKLLGAAGIGAAGIGGMQVASALAEKNADEDAERDMAAYLATFRCDYGHGLNIKGGETGIELPGANSLIPLYQEYVNLANDLKVRKNALGMKPGIESEKILDAATSGLYDNQSIGKVDGAFTSLARALADPTGADAAEWAAQKDATAKKLKTGAIVAGVGIVGSAVGNAIINRNVDEKSDEIKRRYEAIGNIPKPTPLPTERKCSDHDATGTYPECTCTDDTKYFTEEEGCIPCGDGQKYNPTTKQCECTDKNKKPNESENKCTCILPLTENESGECTNPQPPVSGCKLTGLVTQDCKCVDGAGQVGNKCECLSGWYSPDNKTCAECKSSEHKVVVDNQCVCQAPYFSTDDNKTCTECKASENKELKDGKCQCKDGHNPNNTTGKCERIPAPEPLIKISFGSDVLFETGSAKLANNGKTMLDEFNKRLEDAQKNSNEKFDLKTDTDYCISVTGHTDRTPFKGDKLRNDPTNPNNKNMKLSLQRANAVKTKLSDVANPANIWAQGLGENHCTAETYPARNDQKCRRVDIEFWTGSCKSNQESTTSGMLQSAVKGLADNVGNQLIKNITGDTKKTNQ